MHRHRKPQLRMVQTLDRGACAHIKCMGFTSLYSMFRTVNGRDNAREKYPAAKIYSKMFIKLTSGNKITLHFFPIPLVSINALQQERENRRAVWKTDACQTGSKGAKSSHSNRYKVILICNCSHWINTYSVVLSLIYSSFDLNTIPIMKSLITTTKNKE